MLNASPDLSAANAHGCITQLGVEPGARVVDFGCGTGSGTAELARAVGAAGAVVGIDTDASLLACAESRFAWPQLRWKQANACSSGERAGAWDVCWIDRVLAHCPAPERVLAEAARLLRPGGRLFSCEIDYADIGLPRDSSTLPAALDNYSRMIDAPNIARQLPALLQPLFPGARIHRQRHVWELSSRPDVLRALALPIWLRTPAATERLGPGALQRAARELATLARARKLKLLVPVQWTLLWTARGG